MKNRIIILFPILMLFVVFFVSGSSCLSIWPERNFTKEELQTGLINIELVRCKENYESVECKIIYTLNEEEQQYCVEKIASISFIGRSPFSAGDDYAIRFCFEDYFLLIQKDFISYKKYDGFMLEDTESLCTGMAEELINEIVVIALNHYTS